MNEAHTKQVRLLLNVLPEVAKEDRKGNLTNKYKLGF